MEHLTYHIVIGVGEVVVAAAVQGNSAEAAKGGSGSAVTRIAAVVRLVRHVARHGVDRAVGTDHAHDIVAIGDVEVVLLVHGNRVDLPEPGRGGRTAIAVVVAGRAGDRGDDPVAIDLTYAPVGLICDVKVATGVEGQTGGVVELGLDGGSTIAARTPV